MFTELPLSAQTAFAQANDAALAADLSRSVASLRGSFAKKTVKGGTYWYFQHQDEVSGQRRQLYVGPDSEQVRALMGEARSVPADALGPLARAALALGCAGLPRRQFLVIERLADYRFFRAGGVLIGTHAFLACGNLLGVRWGDSDRTEDVDFAHLGKSLAIALPADIDVDTHRAIESLAAGFLPVGLLDGRIGASYRNPKEPEFRLDFLTTLHRGGDKAFEHPKLGVVMQPLPFLEFILEGVAQTTLLSDNGAVVVNVPAPARYALHKLIVYARRASRPKSGKDLAQAAALLACLRERRAWEVEEAWADLIARGPTWRASARRGLEALDRVAPELHVSAWLDRDRAGTRVARAGRTSDTPSAGGRKRSGR